MKKLIKELSRVRKPLPPAMQVIKSKRKRKLEKMLRGEIENDSRNN